MEITYVVIPLHLLSYERSFEHVARGAKLDNMSNVRYETFSSYGESEAVLAYLTSRLRMSGP